MAKPPDRPDSSDDEAYVHIVIQNSEDMVERVLRAICSQKIMRGINNRRHTIAAVLGILASITMCRSGENIAEKVHGKIEAFSAGYDSGKNETLDKVKTCLISMPENATTCVQEVRNEHSPQWSLLNKLQQSLK